MAANRLSLPWIIGGLGLVAVTGTMLRAATPADIARWQAQQAASYAAKQEAVAREAQLAARRCDVAMAELRAAYAASAPRTSGSSAQVPNVIHTASHPGHYYPSSAGYGAPQTLNGPATLMPVQAYQRLPADLPPTLTAPRAMPSYSHTAPVWNGPASHGSCTTSAAPLPMTQYAPVAYTMPTAVPVGGYAAAPLGPGVPTMPYPQPYPQAVAPQPRSPYYVGENLFGQPKLFVDGQPVRNALRSILP